MNGFLNLYKPKGVSSAYILNILKQSIRGETVGHMGTLDPLASGVLPVAIGKSTRLFDYLLDKKKEYIADIEFGYSTDTFDLEGKVVEKSDILPDEHIVQAACDKMIGEIMQVPPAFSAKCIDGKRSYELARKGQILELPPKRVVIDEIKILKRISESKYSVKIICGGGTYIRSIARDLGKACGSCATMTSLVRSASGIFRIENSITVDEFKDTTYKAALLIPPEYVIDYPEIRLNKVQAERLFNGLYDVYNFADGLYKVFEPNSFYGVGEVKNGKIKVKAYIRDNGSL